MVDFTFGQMATVLEYLNQIAPEKRVAFGSRIKHLQKWGIRPEEQPGRGRAGTYSISDLFKMAMGIDLTQAGFPPGQASRLVSENWTTIREALLIVAQKPEHEELDPDNDYLLIAAPSLLRDLMTDDTSVRGHHRDDVFLATVASKVHWQLGNSPKVGKEGRSVLPIWRSTVINATALACAVLFAITKKFKFAETADIRTDLSNALKREEELIEEWLAMPYELSHEMWESVRRLVRVDGSVEPSKTAIQIEMEAGLRLNDISETALDLLFEIYAAGGRNLRETSDDTLTHEKVALDDLATRGLIFKQSDGGFTPSLHGTAAVHSIVRATKAREKEAEANNVSS